MVLSRLTRTSPNASAESGSSIVGLTPVPAMGSLITDVPGSLLTIVRVSRHRIGSVGVKVMATDWVSAGGNERLVRLSR
ncbi:hypothetical protein ES703_04143 [subsurface metagenome]